jgi:hypothetical protein
VKRSGRDEPIWVVIYKCMKTTQKVSLQSYPYLKLPKPPCFSYYLLCFYFNKIREQEGGTGSAQKVGGGRVAQTMYTRISTCENDKIKKFFKTNKYF